MHKAQVCREEETHPKPENRNFVFIINLSATNIERRSEVRYGTGFAVHQWTQGQVHQWGMKIVRPINTIFVILKEC